MTKTISFQHVSKCYHLGLTRTSLPALIGGWARRITNHAQESSIDNKYLWALDDVSFCLNQGKSLALVGPNGAGKSTILKLLAGITQPTSGEISINGRVSALIELGAGFHPDLTGRENIYLNGTILGLKRDEIKRRFDKIVAFSEVERFLDTPVKRYSSGMAVRLGFSVAACIDPDILLVDEVLAVGDISFRQKCMRHIQNLLDKGTSLIFVSHHMALVRAVCQNALYLDHGRVKLHGYTDEVIDLYNHTLNEERARNLENAGSQDVDLPSDIGITRVEIVGFDGNKPKHFIPEQAAKVRMKYSAYKTLQTVHVVVRIIRSDGIFCSVIYSRRDGVKMFIEEGAGEINVTFNPLQLYPGTYYIAATIKNEDESVDIARGWSDWFKVTGLGQGYEDRDAVFEPMRSWQHSKLDSSEEPVQDALTKS